MLTFLKNHPFPVEAFFESSLVLTYALPIAVLRALVPPQLELDVFRDQWAFVAIAVVKTKQLRPKGFPVFMGHDFVLTGYRVFVRYTTSEGKRLRGLYILKSETDQRKMEFLGNAFTHYNYTTTDISMTDENEMLTVRSIQSGIDIRVDTTHVTTPDLIQSGVSITVDTTHADLDLIPSAVNIGADAKHADVDLPVGSPFANWREARRFAGPLPFTFSCGKSSKQVLIIEGVRENWTPVPVKVLHSHIRYLDTPQFQEARLANAFLIRRIPYYWKRGKMDLWKG